jgi:hypothetical protein
MDILFQGGSERREIKVMDVCMKIKNLGGSGRGKIKEMDGCEK